MAEARNVPMQERPSLLAMVSDKGAQNLQRLQACTERLQLLRTRMFGERPERAEKEGKSLPCVSGTLGQAELLSIRTAEQLVQLERVIEELEAI